MLAKLSDTITRLFGGSRPGGKSVFTPLNSNDLEKLKRESVLGNKMASPAQLAPLAYLNKPVTREQVELDLSTDPVNPLGTVVIRRKGKDCYIVVISDKSGREIARCAPMVSRDSALRIYAALQDLVGHPDTLLPTKARNE
jgi:hypothetical protein